MITWCADRRLPFVAVGDIGAATITKPVGHATPHFSSLVPITLVLGGLGAKLDKMGAAEPEFAQPIVDATTKPSAIDKNRIRFMQLDHAAYPARHIHEIGAVDRLIDEIPGAPSPPVYDPCFVPAAPGNVDAQDQRHVRLIRRRRLAGRQYEFTADI